MRKHSNQGRKISRFFPYASFLMIAFLALQSVVAQHLTEKEILDADKLFEQGRFDETIVILNNKKNSRISNTSKSNYMKLLSASYYEIDEIEKGDSVMHRFLRAFPLYQSNKAADPEAFMVGMQRFKVKPRLSFGVRLGDNRVSPVIINSYQISPSVDYTEPYQTYSGFNTGLFIELHLFYNFSVQLATIFQTMEYSKTIYYDTRENAEFIFTDQILRVEVPLALLYNTNFRNFLVSPYVGFAPLYNRSNISAEYMGDAVPITQNNRMEFNVRTIYGLRVGIQRANVEFYLDYSRRNDLLPHVDNNFMRELYYPHMYVDDEIVLDNHQFSAGASIRILYKVSNKYD